MKNTPVIDDCRFLIVDDDNDDQEFLEEILKELFPNCPAFCVYNGEEAINYMEANKKPPFMVFLDLNMPRVNGFEFLKYYQGHKNFKGSHVVVYTTSSSVKDKEASLNLGAFDFLSKTSDLGKLKTTVTQIVHRASLS